MGEEVEQDACESLEHDDGRAQLSRQALDPIGGFDAEGVAGLLIAVEPALDRNASRRDIKARLCGAARIPEARTKTARNRTKSGDLRRLK